MEPGIHFIILSMKKFLLTKKEILLVSRSGLALESNILAILKELNQPEYKEFSKVLAVQKKQKRADSEKTGTVRDLSR